MKIRTMSIVCGTNECNSHCPFCVSRTTPNMGIGIHKGCLSSSINWRNFQKACRLAQIGGATTILLTGKGEPTLYPRDISGYLKAIENYQFPFIELQTNGIAIGNEELTYGGGYEYLRDWYNLGLNTICLSAVHYDQKLNQKIYGKNYPDLAKTVEILHDVGFTVRLSIMMLRGYIDDQWKVQELIGFCKGKNIEQLTVRPIARPNNNQNTVTEWIDRHTIDLSRMQIIQRHFADHPHCKQILKLAHGATVYDFNGQNICLTNCLTTNETDEDIRQIIFYPSGRISYDWKYQGAILL